MVPVFAISNLKVHLQLLPLLLTHSKESNAQSTSSMSHSRLETLAEFWNWLRLRESSTMRCSSVDRLRHNLKVRLSAPLELNPQVLISRTHLMRSQSSWLLLTILTSRSRVSYRGRLSQARWLICRSSMMERLTCLLRDVWSWQLKDCHHGFSTYKESENY